MRALVVNTSDESTTVHETPGPKPGLKEILLRVRAAALNHAVYMNAAMPLAAQENRVLGSDFAAQVIQVGEDLADLEGPRTKIGSRVSRFLQGASSVNGRPGAFAEYDVIDYDLTCGIPDSIAFRDEEVYLVCMVEGTIPKWI